jgi:hypothetical protein
MCLGFSGKFTMLEKQAIAVLHAAGFRDEHISKVLHRARPISVKQNLIRWEKEFPKRGQKSCGCVVCEAIMNRGKK